MPNLPQASLAVRVKPRAARDALALDGDRVIVQVRAPAAEGQANRAVIEVVAAALGVPKSSVSIARGLRSRDKLLRIAGLTAETLQARLERLPGQGSEQERLARAGKEQAP
jgi:hypothetical protein